MQSRSFQALSVAFVANIHRFVERYPKFHPIAETGESNPGEILEVVLQNRIRPSADVLKVLWKIPMVKGDHGLNAVCEEGVDYFVVVADSVRIDDVSVSSRKDPGPG